MRRFFAPLLIIASSAAPALALRCEPNDRDCLELSARLRSPTLVPGRETRTPAETARALEETTARLRSRSGRPAGPEDQELAGQVLYYADLMKRQLDAERDALRGDTGGAADYLRNFAGRITNELGGNSAGMTLDQLRSYLAEQTRTAADAGRFVARQIEKAKTPPAEETPPTEERPAGAAPARPGVPAPPASPAPDGAPEPERWTPPPPGEEDGGDDDEQDAQDEEKSRKADEARRRAGQNAAASRRRTESRMKDGAALLQDMATDAGGAPSGGTAANDSAGGLVARGPDAPGSRGVPGDGTRPAPPPPGAPAPDGAQPLAPAGAAGEAERRLDDFLVKNGLAGGASAVPAVVRAQAEREARLVRGSDGGFVNGANARRPPDDRFDAYLASVKKHLAVYEFALKKYDPANPAFKDIVLDSSARAALLRWSRTCVPADAACSRVAGLAGLLRYRSGEPVPMSVIAKLVAELSDKTLAGAAARGGKSGGMPEHRRPSALKAMLKALGIGGDDEGDAPTASRTAEAGASSVAGGSSYAAGGREPLELSDPARRHIPGAPPAPDEAKLPWWKRLWRWLKGLFVPAAKP